MKIAVVGAGISGISAAYYLQRHHEVTIYEREPNLGGHANTVMVRDHDDHPWAIDTGFIVFNDKNYPLFRTFINSLGVTEEKSNMSFSFTDKATHTSYAGTKTGLFPQLHSMLDMKHVRMLVNIYRYSRKLAKSNFSSDIDGKSIRDYLVLLGCPIRVIDLYFIPISAAIWSCKLSDAANIPAKAYKEFFSNHGLLQLRDRPKWRTVRGGSHIYIRAFQETFKGLIRTSSPVESIEDSGGKVRLSTFNKLSDSYDHVIVATHADSAAGLVMGLPDRKRDLLESFKYSKNKVYLHTDTRYMPQQKRYWASWNVISDQDADLAPGFFITYHMNRLQNIKSSTQFLLSLNPATPPSKSNILYETEYSHPILSCINASKEEKMNEINFRSRIKFCGSYTGYGFHEDGFMSGKKIADLINS